MYEIRVYYQRYNMNPDYYEGNKGIARRWKAKTPEELLKKLKLHAEKYVGETYSVWDGNQIILGGAYDPDDGEVIREYFCINDYG